MDLHDYIIVGMNLVTLIATIVIGLIIRRDTIRRIDNREIEISRLVRKIVVAVEALHRDAEAQYFLTKDNLKELFESQLKIIARWLEIRNG